MGKVLRATLIASVLGAVLGALVAQVEHVEVAVAANADRPGSVAIEQVETGPVSYARRRVVVPVPADAASSPDDADSDNAATETDDEPAAEPKPLRTDGLPLTVRVIDGETGSALRARVGLFHDPDERGLATTLRWEHGAARLDGSPARAGCGVDLRFTVEPPRGFVVPDPEKDLRRYVIVSPFAEEVAVTLVLRPISRLALDVTDKRGRRSRHIRWTRLSVGRLALHHPKKRPFEADVPFFRGARLIVTATNHPVETAKALRLTRHTPKLAMHLTHQGEDWVSQYRGPVGEVPGCYGRTDPFDGTGTIELWLRRVDGRPAQGVGVRLSRRSHRGLWDSKDTDDAGHLRIENVPAGKYHLRASISGFVETETTIEVADGEHRRVVLDEDPGRTVVVRAVGVDGTPLPFARLHVDAGGKYIAHVESGVAYVDRFTDATGTCVVARVSRRSFSVEGAYAGNEARGREMDDDVRGSATVVIPD